MFVSFSPTRPESGLHAPDWQSLQSGNSATAGGWGNEKKGKGGSGREGAQRRVAAQPLHTRAVASSTLMVDG